MHEAARAEKDLHGVHIGMAAGAPDIDQPILFDLVGDHLCNGIDAFALLFPDARQIADSLVKKLLHDVLFHFVFSFSWFSLQMTGLPR